MPRARTPNHALATLLVEADLSYEALARAVNRVGAETGLDLRYDRTSVAHWIAGSRPQPPVAIVLAEALSRRLNRPVTPEETGCAHGTLPAPPLWPPDTVAGLRDLGRADMDLTRRAVLRSTVYSVAALAAVPAWAELTARHGLDRDATVRIGPSEVETVQTMADAFSSIDDRFGGGHARSSVAAYIANDLATWLNADATPEVRSRMQSAAADLVYLAGFMAWDDGAHGLAEHYFLHALPLAAEAGDSITYATILRGMSTQATDLGHHSEALHLIQAAQSAAGAAAAPRMRAFLLGQEAVALAALGDRKAALRAFATCERQLEAATSQVETFGSYHHASLAYQEAHIRARLGDLGGAVKAMELSNRKRPVEERRSRAISTAYLAEYQYRAGHLEAACGSWEAFLDDYPYLTAGRADTVVARLHRIAGRHPGNSRVRRIKDRLDRTQV